MGRSTFKRHLPLAAVAAAGAALGVLPSIAASSGPASVVAVDYRWSPTEVAVTPGGAVAFSYPSGVSRHYPVFIGTPPSCTAGVPTSDTADGPSWSGSCTYAAAGVYQYYCGVHGTSMSGTVYVNADGTVPSTTPPPTTTTTLTTPTGPGPGPGGGGGGGGAGGSGGGGSPGAPSAGPAIVSGSLTLPAVQRGRAVTGAMVVGPGGARLTVGLALPASQARARTISAGSLSRRVAAGPVRFSVSLNRAGRHALSRHHRVRLTVHIHAAPQGAGTASDLVGRVSLRA